MTRIFHNGIRYFRRKDIPTLRILLEMVVARDLFETLPTEKDAAMGTNHFVAAFGLRYGELAIRTLLGTLL